MRKTSLFACIFLVGMFLVSDLVAQKRTATRRVTSKSHTQVLTKIQALNEEPDVEFEMEPPKNVWPECAETEKVNSPAKCEAYPWLSADGLRMYFTSNRDGGHGNLYFTERKTTSEPFGKAVKLFNTNENRYYAASLTSDELTMYLTLEGYTLYVAERKSRSERFSEPKVVKEFEERKLYGPGVSPDGREIIVVDYNSKEQSARSGKTVVWLVKGPDGKFTEQANMALPEEMVPGPGQFGKDGLSYYCSMMPNNAKPEYLYCFTRTATGSSFSFSHKLPEAVNITRSSLQPSVNGDGTLLAYVINNDGMWNGDDIRVIQLDKPLSEKDAQPQQSPALLVVNKLPVINVLPTVAPAPITTTGKQVEPGVQLALETPLKTSSKQAITPKTVSPVQVYPNPFTETITIQFNQPVTGNILFELFDANGKRVLAQPVNGKNSTVSVKTNITTAGTYTCRVTGTGGILFTGTLVSK